MLLPRFDETELLKCLCKMIDIEREWVPKVDGFSLYIRPLLFSTSPTLALKKPTHSRILICCSPVGPYFPTGFNAVKVVC